MPKCSAPHCVRSDIINRVEMRPSLSHHNGFIRLSWANRHLSARRPNLSLAGLLAPRHRSQLAVNGVHCAHKLQFIMTSFFTDYQTAMHSVPHVHVDLRTFAFAFHIPHVTFPIPIALCPPLRPPLCPPLLCCINFHSLHGQRITSISLWACSHWIVSAST